jgi:hypothetical protein
VGAVGTALYYCTAITAKLLDRLGVLAPDASSALREEYARRAGVAAAYREASGHARALGDCRRSIAPQGSLGGPGPGRGS